MCTPVYGPIICKDGYGPGPYSRVSVVTETNGYSMVHSDGLGKGVWPIP